MKQKQTEKKLTLLLKYLDSSPTRFTNTGTNENKKEKPKNKFTKEYK